MWTARQTDRYDEVNSRFRKIENAPESSDKCIVYTYTHTHARTHTHTHILTNITSASSQLRLTTIHKGLCAVSMLQFYS
jgi:hypothetical protein